MNCSLASLSAYKELRIEPLLPAKTPRGVFVIGGGMQSAQILTDKTLPFWFETKS